MMNFDELRPAPPVVQLERLRAVDFPALRARAHISARRLAVDYACWRMLWITHLRCCGLRMLAHAVDYGSVGPVD